MFTTLNQIIGVGVAKMEQEIIENPKKIDRESLKPFTKGWKGGPGRPKASLDSPEKKLERKIKKEVHEVVMTYLETQALKAAKRINDLGENAEHEPTKLSANKDILDRVGVGTKNSMTAVAVQVNLNQDRESFK